jgi:hypothetical protein
MDGAARVVLIGDEVEHMQAKASVLRHFWPVRLLPPEPARLAQVAAEVAVVCVTLSERDRQECVDRLRERSPALLIVKMNGYDAGPQAGADAIVDEARGPGALVSTIYQLLTERGLPSRAWPEHPEAAWVQ